MKKISIENEAENTDKKLNIKVVDRLRVFGVFQKFGIENANGRIYPEHILKKQVEQYQKLIDDRRSYGELNHPESDISCSLYKDEQKELCFKLRVETGMGMMACKKCLERNNWNYGEAKKNYRQFQWDGKLY